MSSLVTEDNKRKRSGSDESTDSNTSTRAVSNPHHDVLTSRYNDEFLERARNNRIIEKDKKRFQAVWREANDEEKKLIREIIERGGKIIGKDVGAMSLYEKWKMLRYYATKEEKDKILKVWDRTTEGKWVEERKGRKRRPGTAPKGLRF